MEISAFIKDLQDVKTYHFFTQFTSLTPAEARWLPEDAGRLQAQPSSCPNCSHCAGLSVNARADE